MLARDYVIYLVLANIAALPVAWLVMNSWLQNFVFRTRSGLALLIFTAVLSLAIAILTVSYQTLKAALVEPANTLRCE